jgi:NAD(P)H-flavin reductase/hemoglobin-like flavoprotein
MNIDSGVNVVFTESRLADSFAGAESQPSGAGPEPSVTLADLDTRALKDSLARVMAEGPVVMEDFYTRLFSASPETRALFPVDMTAQRERMFATLAQVVWGLDNQPACAQMLAQLGRDHRRYGVTAKHYRGFFAALCDTVADHLCASWTAEAETAWRTALDYISAAMRAAADADAQTSPAWWIGEIVGHELRSPGVAVLRLRPDPPLPYQAGQYVPVQVAKWPWHWRPYSIANAPRTRGGGLIELHVRAVPGGLVSNTLVHDSVAGECVILGAAAGPMTLADTGRDLLCIAGGTGLAPIKAIIEQAIALPPPARPRKITLFVGARQQFDLYDLEDLQLLESAYAGLRVIPVLSDEPGYQGLTGTLPDVVGGHGLFENTEAYVCGPAAMVSQTTALLAASLPPGQIHRDPLPMPAQRGSAR